MNQEQMAEQVEQCLLWLQEQKGKNLHMTEQLCSLEGTDDRHFTTAVQFVMQLETALWRVSGARISCLGSDGAVYEVCTDQLKQVELSGQGCVFVECLGAGWTRRSELMLRE